MSEQITTGGRRKYSSVLVRILRLRNVEGSRLLKSVLSLSNGCVVLIRSLGGGWQNRGLISAQTLHHAIVLLISAME